MGNYIEQVIIDPRCKMNYASYYLHGLYELFDNVWSCDDFLTSKGIEPINWSLGKIRK